MTGAESSPDPAAALGRFVAGLDPADLPEPVVREAERRVLDTVAVGVAGATTGRAGTAATEAVAGLSGDGSATLFGGGSAPPHDAALANAVAGHALDWDDVLSAIHVHPSVPVVPAVLAVGERTDASGAAALAAYVAGVEAQWYLAAPLTPGHYERGWHATGTWGVFGAAAATASVLGLGAGQTTHALNLAASTAAGLKRNFGSGAKPFHAGHACAAGVVAAHLADAGLDASADALTGSDGFYDLYRGADPPALDALPALGDGWVLRDVGLDTKRYPCCYFAHAPVAAASTLARETGADPADVEGVTVRASRAARDALSYDRPTTGLEAKFSMPHAVACAVTRDAVGPEAFTDDAVRDGPTARLRERVAFDVDPDLPYGSHAARVTLALADGRRPTRERSAPPGSPDAPLSEAALREKFDRCVAGAAADPDALYRRLDGLRDGAVAAALAPLREAA